MTGESVLEAGFIAATSGGEPSEPGLACSIGIRRWYNSSAKKRSLSVGQAIARGWGPVGVDMPGKAIRRNSFLLKPLSAFKNKLSGMLAASSRTQRSANKVGKANTSWCVLACGVAEAGSWPWLSVRNSVLVI